MQNVAQHFQTQNVGFKSQPYIDDNYDDNMDNDNDDNDDILIVFKTL